MDRAWLERELEAGRSIESLAREVGRSPSTLWYWVRKFGLRSAHAERHAARGGLDRERLAELAGEGRSGRAIAAELGVSQSTVRYWLGRHGLRTAAESDAETPGSVVLVCPRHGEATHVVQATESHRRCVVCRRERVLARRRRVKRILVDEAGGRCALCGYDRHLGALQFHHLDPATKAFGLSSRGIARGLERCRQEARKCVLLCANCHAEVEAGIASIGPAPPVDRPVRPVPG